jgi:hypothetical protein
VNGSASVRAAIGHPAYSFSAAALVETMPGLFEAEVTGATGGIYRFNVIAEGTTYCGAPFTREQLLNGALFEPGQIVPRLVNDGSSNARVCGPAAVPPGERCDATPRGLARLRPCSG